MQRLGRSVKGRPYGAEACRDSRRWTSGSVAVPRKAALEGGCASWECHPSAYLSGRGPAWRMDRRHAKRRAPCGCAEGQTRVLPRGRNARQVWSALLAQGTSSQLHNCRKEIPPQRYRKTVGEADAPAMIWMMHPNYPTRRQIDDWCERILARSQEEPLTVKHLDAPSYAFQLGVRHTEGNHYVAFEAPGRATFYGYWQPASTGPAPVLFHLPGYGAEMSAHPELVEAGFNVLHITPLGYGTPQGPSQVGRPWPVLPDTVKRRGRQGYVDWLRDAASAVIWALSQKQVEPSRYGFFGSSQGGGTPPLLGSIFAGRGVKAVAADVLYLINFPLMYKQKNRGAYETAFSAMASPAGIGTSGVRWTSWMSRRMHTGCTCPPF